MSWTSEKQLFLKWFESETALLRLMLQIQSQSWRPHTRKVLERTIPQTLTVKISTSTFSDPKIEDNCKLYFNDHYNQFERSEAPPILIFLNKGKQAFASVCPNGLIMQGVSCSSFSGSQWKISSVSGLSDYRMFGFLQKSKKSFVG